MKRLLCILLVVGVTAPVRAQLLSPLSVGSAFWGGLIGGIIGNNHHGQTAEGVAIGAGAGLLLGAMADANRRSYAYAEYTPPPYRYGAIPYAGTGAVLGGVAGGIIGHNHHGQTAEGVAIGAASGLVLGAIADHARARRVAPYVPTEVRQAAPAPPVAPVPSTAQNSAAVANVASSPVRSSPPSPMSSANALFGR